MLSSLTKKYIDLSTPTYFLFRFVCDCCGDTWESDKYPFSQQDTVPKTEDERYVRELIWRSEHDAAYERANNEAIFHFNKCPRCGKRVCDDCYLITDDLCTDCAKVKAMKGA